MQYWWCKSYSRLKDSCQSLHRHTSRTCVQISERRVHKGVKGNTTRQHVRSMTIRLSFCVRRFSRFEAITPVCMFVCLPVCLSVHYSTYTHQALHQIYHTCLYTESILTRHQRYQLFAYLSVHRFMARCVSMSVQREHTENTCPSTFCTSIGW